MFRRRHNEDEDVTMTPEEKEMLRILMETPGIEDEWDFFEEMRKNISPPEYFMRERPDPYWLDPVRKSLAVVSITSSVILVVFSFKYRRKKFR